MDDRTSCVIFCFHLIQEKFELRAVLTVSVTKLSQQKVTLIDYIQLRHS